MTGFAQVKSQTGDGTAFTLSLKSVNHRFLDPQLRLPPEMDELEIKIRRILKERLARGHIEVTLSLERRGCQGFEFNRELVSGYVSAFRKAAAEFATLGEPVSTWSSECRARWARRLLWTATLNRQCSQVWIRPFKN